MIRPSLYARFAIFLCALWWATSPLLAQTATEYNDKDKKKLAEIAQRPEVIHKIEDTWDARRRADMEFAFNVNQSSRIGELSLSELATFRQNFGELYNNPILERYVNTLGQKIVPQGSPNLYSFRLLLDPVPRAEALTTGTIYISTGLVSMIDSEAQLAYILGHEIAHVEKRHVYNTIRNEILEEEFDKEKQADVGQEARDLRRSVRAWRRSDRRGRRRVLRGTDRSGHRRRRRNRRSAAVPQQIPAHGMVRGL